MGNKNDRLTRDQRGDGQDNDGDTTHGSTVVLSAQLSALLCQAINACVDGERAAEAAGDRCRWFAWRWYHLRLRMLIRSLTPPRNLGDLGGGAAG
jgi:hypothetical protein